MSDSLWSMDCSPPGSSVHRILQAEYWSRLPFPSPGRFPNSGSNPWVLCFLHWQAGSLPLGPLSWWLREWRNYLQCRKPSLIPGQEDPPEKAMAPHSSTLAWKIPWTEEPGRLQSMGSRRVGHDWATSLSLFTFMHWRRKWQLTPVFLPGKSHGQRSLAGYNPWGRKESDMTEQLSLSKILILH